MSLAQTLDRATRTARAVPQPPPGAVAGSPEAEVRAAYDVQDDLVRFRLDRGERLTGAKLGFTSEGKRRQMGVHDLILGRVTDGMAVPDGADLDLSAFIHPRVEPEVVYLLGRRIATVADAFAEGAVAAVAPGIEIIDSRYENFRFSLADVIADNTSAAGYAVGAWQPYDPAAWNRGVVFELDGRPAHMGSTAAILGDPRRAVVEAARLAERIGLVLEPGWLLLAGAATPAEPLTPGTHVRVEVQGLGSVSFTARPAGEGAS
ncbi:2-oxo-3-hexenedioate decarboxylase [Sinosporangium album]|uniref:2-oxo-3-hexenedioate decarboxylase n=1 Tax=Sinosporangium album TaxID=504805 RepID=A0A1G8HGK3_9ACTN|nr:fumarylacetoacetate hydrolase family protein [Sinosporangium album]SDI05600.1 2-oxo-3-hexenedioate decarboxylase [Sinosporangium album]